MKATIQRMLDNMRSAIGQCPESDKEVLEAILDEAEGWKMRLEELDDEVEDASQED